MKNMKKVREGIRKCIPDHVLEYFKDFGVDLLEDTKVTKIFDMSYYINRLQEQKFDFLTEFDMSIKEYIYIAINPEMTNIPHLQFLLDGYYFDEDTKTLYVVRPKDLRDYSKLDINNEDTDQNNNMEVTK